MGNNNTINKINFDDMNYAIKSNKYLIINVLDANDQLCLIKNTIPYNQEETIINNYLQKDKSINIIVYGKNCNDDLIYKKYSQLKTLGFYSIYLYVGGMFEWLLLQDIYTDEVFPTTSKCIDILKFKPYGIIHVQNYLLQ